jgi:hypothetical protein
MWSGCPQVDYRRSYEETKYSPCLLPESLSKQIIAATAAFGLKFAGWDFKVTDDNEYWCLEANPMPGYDGYDIRAAGEITNSLLELLGAKLPNSRGIDFDSEIFTEEVITTEQCAEIYSIIQSLKELWIPRGESPAAFFTLGTASYLDFLNEPNLAGEYYTRAKKYNSLMQKHFGWLYELLKASLEHQLGTPISYKQDFAMPGFHIWQTPAIITKPTASIHFDLQYQNLNWQNQEKIDFSHTISFTLPIKLPKGGGGLNVWDLNYEEYINPANQNAPGEIEVMKRFRNKTLHPYKVGNIVLHGGHTLHQIAAIAQVYPEDERITLQGHGLYIDGEWQLYW